ncbi:hypothetical protein BS47DRAFT_1485083 [Hydnum rufescens UP504]|uniref:Uncharacterized protein n=1 Tax=Hydnum rufescens UP504 TaxID=1448309 RepID=A0A9P6AZ34_9AGAM|nr:hypothetical protein BS47DRAFT_1485083 [Hydnum rufescens UP504]
MEVATPQRVDDAVANANYHHGVRNHSAIPSFATENLTVRLSSTSVYASNTLRKPSSDQWRIHPRASYIVRLRLACDIQYATRWSLGLYIVSTLWRLPTDEDFTETAIYAPSGGDLERKQRPTKAVVGRIFPLNDPRPTLKLRLWRPFNKFDKTVLLCRCQFLPTQLHGVLFRELGHAPDRRPRVIDISAQIAPNKTFSQ